jgi:hypothetical protein
MHEIINRRAAQSLSGPAGDAWGPLAVDLGRHASDADHRKSSVSGERPRHFIDIDAYEPPPFAGVPRTFEGVQKKYGSEAATRWGVVPWAIEECYEMTVLSLRAGDWESAGAWAADLGHYVADSHQPLHCTINYDGQRSGNEGVHLRFEVTMMDRYFAVSNQDDAAKTHGRIVTCAVGAKAGGGQDENGNTPQHSLQRSHGTSSRNKVEQAECSTHGGG